VTMYYHAVGAGGVAEPAAAAAAGQQIAAQCVWGYAGATGPAAWADLCEGQYALCGAGTQQSPIDFRRADAVVRAGRAAGGDEATLGWRVPAAPAAAYFAPAAGAATPLESFNGFAFEVRRRGRAARVALPVHRSDSPGLVLYGS
jgi:hypothetical protein